MGPEHTEVARPTWRDYVSMLRVTQWQKNYVVLAALFFALGDRSQHIALANALRVIPAAFLFCLVSSGIYVLNDILDLESDRSHPVKRMRAIAAGRIPVARARIIALALLVAGGAGSLVLHARFGAIVLAYVCIQLLYGVWLKRIPLVDIMVIASGFVLRAVAGAAVLDGVAISPWLVVCTFLLALFLATCKRRHEKVMVETEDDRHRPAMARYDEKLLDQLIAVISSATIVSYAIYTLWPETVKKFGTSGLGLTIPLVVFGLFRYLDLVYRHSKGDRPEKILLSDLPLLLTVVAYSLLVFVIFAISRAH